MARYYLVTVGRNGTTVYQRVVQANTRATARRRAWGSYLRSSRVIGHGDGNEYVTVWRSCVKDYELQESAEAGPSTTGSGASS